ncbi:MAG: peptide chain release factor 2 [Rhodospirillaceae bacterium]|jgi:peptide chain release factor 2|nr:peptide chain release factor 2 [Rhodospirillaceae bacterium]
MSDETEMIINDINQSIELLKRHLDWKNAISRLNQLTIDSNNHNLWNDIVIAQKVMRELTHLEQSINVVHNIEHKRDDFLDLIKLGEMENDQSIITDAEEGLRTLREHTNKIKLENLLSKESNSNDCYLEVHAGAGGTEAQDWAEILLRMYIRWAEHHDYKVVWLEENSGEEAGLKSATIKINGRNAYGWLKTESGVHRLVRISPFDSASRRHTSFSSVWVYSVIDDSIDIKINESDCRIDTFRASGAGGQHINKTDSAIRITHIPTGIVVNCQADRSQHRNRSMAWNMLRARMYESELQKREAVAQAVADSKTEIGWGRHIRSYILQPYQMVKDLRTGVETSDIKGVLDGNLDSFMIAALAARIG